MKAGPPFGSICKPCPDLSAFTNDQTFHTAAESINLRCADMRSSGPRTNSLAELRLADGRTIQARLVVGADGARSRTRQLAGSKSPSMNTKHDSRKSRIPHEQWESIA